MDLLFYCPVLVGFPSKQTLKQRFGDGAGWGEGYWRML